MIIELRVTLCATTIEMLKIALFIAEEVPNQVAEFSMEQVRLH